MKVRIKGNSLRFRLTQSEVEALENQEKVTDSVTFSPSDALHFVLEPWKMLVYQVVMDRDSIIVRIPQDVLHGWHDDDREGFSEVVDNGGSGLKLVIEKDFSCLKSRPDEDESDNFPNPLEGKEKC